jgi:uncharacterized membrane protein
MLIIQILVKILVVAQQMHMGQILGINAGYNAINAYNSNFVIAGYVATGASSSNFIGGS